MPDGTIYSFERHPDGTLILSRSVRVDHGWEELPIVWTGDQARFGQLVDMRFLTWWGDG
jgi:hypothetical protein